MKLFDSTAINKQNKKRENAPILKAVEGVLFQCNLVDDQYQQRSRVLYSSMPNKSYAYLLNVEPSNLVFLKTYNIEFNEIIITFTDQNRNGALFYRTKNKKIC